MSSSPQRYKVVLLGEGRVGKTSIVLRFTKGEYDDRQQSTIQASFIDKKLSVDGNTVNLSIWDTAGQERFHALAPIYYRDADVAIVVYDVTDVQSFEKVKNWVKELKTMVGGAAAMIIVGNKIDDKNRAVNDSDAVTYAQSVGAAHMLTSAKSNRGIDELFLDVGRKVLSNRAYRRQTGVNSQRSSAGRSKLVMIDDTGPVEPPAKSSWWSSC